MRLWSDWNRTRELPDVRTRTVAHVRRTAPRSRRAVRRTASARGSGPGRGWARARSLTRSPSPGYSGVPGGYRTAHTVPPPVATGGVERVIGTSAVQRPEREDDAWPHPRPR